MRLVKVILCWMVLLYAGLATAQNPPKLVFKEKRIEFGQFSIAKRDTTVVFHYRNEGDFALVISNVQPTCGCVKPEFSTEPLQPGDSAVIKAKLVPYHTGQFFQVLAIINNSPETLIKVAVSGQITE